MKKKKKKKKPWKQKRKKVFFRINTSKRAYDENKIITLTRVTLFFFLKIRTIEMKDVKGEEREE